MNAAVRSMRWEEDRLILLDQRALPAAIAWVECRTAAATAEAIRGMVVRGAPAIGCAAAFGIALAARASAAEPAAADPLPEAFALLRSSRPTAVNLFWALDRMARVAAPAETGMGDRKARARRLEAEAREIFEEDLRINVALGRHGAALLPQSPCVITHCNAGALATAGHGTALGIVRSARDSGRHIQVFAGETRPWLQGARLTAWEMVQEGIPVTLIADSAAGLLLARGGIDAVIVGADRIAANGDVANKIGTYPLAVLARRHGVPFYVAAPCSTLDPATADGAAIAIEERAAGEVFGWGAQRWAAEGAQAWNPAFDVTPAELVSAIITERGVLRPPWPESIRAALAPDRG